MEVSSLTWNDIWFNIISQFEYQTYNYFIPDFSKRYIIRIFSQLLKSVGNLSPKEWLEKQGYPRRDINIFLTLTSNISKNFDKSSNKSSKEKLFNVLASWTVFYLFSKIDQYLKKSTIPYPYIDPWLIKTVIEDDSLQRIIFEENKVNFEVQYDFSREEKTQILINRDLFLGVISGLNSYSVPLQLVIEGIEIDPYDIIEESRINEIEDSYLIIIKDKMTYSYYFNSPDFITGIASVLIWICAQNYDRNIIITSIKDGTEYKILWKNKNPFLVCSK